MGNEQPTDEKSVLSEMFLAIGARGSPKHGRHEEGRETRDQKLLAMAEFFPPKWPPLPVDLVPYPPKVLPFIPERRHERDEDGR